MPWLVVGLLVPVAAVYPWMARCDRDAPRGLATIALRICLAFGLGIGVSSCVYFFAMLLAGPPGAAYRIAETAGWALVGLLGRIRLGTDQKGTGTFSALKGRKMSQSLPDTALRWRRLLAAVFVLALALAALGAVADYRKAPLGDWDAWTIWNQRARFLFRAGDSWREAFSPVFAHTDYPLLLPCSNARLWRYFGMESSWTPWLLGCLFTLAAVGVLTAGVSRLRSPCQGFLAGLSLLGMVAFLQRGTLQYADVPLAYYMLSAIVLLAMHDAATAHRGLSRFSRFNAKMELSPSGRTLILSGVMAGMAAWTKNEGLVFLVVLAAARGVVVWRRSGAKQMLVDSACWVLGVVPALAAVVAQKTCLAGANEFVTGQDWHALLARLSDPWRYAEIAQALLVHALQIARPFAVVLPLCLLWLGLAKCRNGDRSQSATATVVLLLMSAAYFAIYLVTPSDLAWHLHTSAERLLLQLLPLALWIFFLRLATPEETLAEMQTNRLAGGLARRG